MKFFLRSLTQLFPPGPFAQLELEGKKKLKSKFATCIFVRREKEEKAP